MPLPQPAGVQMPRYVMNGKAVRADRIETVDGNAIRLESGARVEAVEVLMSSGPARTGDYLVHDEGAAPEEGRLVAGADFVTRAKLIPHNYDIPSVSADSQPGFREGEPSSGSPADPDADKPPVIGAAAVGDSAEPERRE